ncbi:MAG: ABC transporter substrate-binding protein, partial [Rhodospirillaceae bacterium]|nr:ABC transporter substrate-binding protein [Rhodospirillaceae bacterium]
MFRSRMFLKALVILGLLGLGATPAPAADTAAASAAVERFHGALLANMKDGKALGFDGRKQKLEPVIKDTFDLPAMARVSTGAAWTKMPEDERAKVIAAFTDWTVASYAANFKEWDGEAFVTKGAREDGKGNIMVETALNLKNAAPVAFTYRMRDSGGAPRIVDIFLDGAVSQMAMHRSQFAAALSAGGVANLLKHMQDLTAKAKEG